MARRPLRGILGATALLVGGFLAPGMARAASTGGLNESSPTGNREGAVDLAVLYIERLSHGDPVVSQTASPREAPRTILAALADVPRVAAAELGEMRAGFALPDGLFVSFGYASSTFLNGASTPIQTLNVDFTASASGYAGTVTTLTNGVTTIKDIATSNVATSVITNANNGLTSVQSALTSAGLTTIISNQANNQLIQHVQTLDLATSGLKPILDQQVAQSIVANGLGASNALRGR